MKISSLASIVAMAALGLAPMASESQDLSALVGTAEVNFAPVQEQGVLVGCTLVYRAFSLDHAYRQGKLIAIAGNITTYFGANRDKPALTLRVATGDVAPGDLKPEAPHFAYLQTPAGTTAKSVTRSIPSDPIGARIFLHPIDLTTLPIIFDLLEGKEIEIGFNRTANGIDVLVPIDLSVESSNLSNGKMEYKRSSIAVTKFRACFARIFKEMKQQSQKKTR